MSTDEERRLKHLKAVGREVEPHELPLDLRLIRLEKIALELLRRVERLEHQDDARGMSGIMIGGPSND